MNTSASHLLDEGNLPLARRHIAKQQMVRAWIVGAAESNKLGR